MAYARGASARAAGVDIVLNLVAHRAVAGQIPDKLELQVAKSRFSLGETLTIKPIDDGDFEMADGSEGPQTRVGEARLCILEALLQAGPDGLQTRDILLHAAARGHADSTTRRAQRDLWDAREIQRLGRGRYAILEEAESAHRSGRPIEQGEQSGRSEQSAVPDGDLAGRGERRSESVDAESSVDAHGTIEAKPDA